MTENGRQIGDGLKEYQRNLRFLCSKDLIELGVKNVIPIDAKSITPQCNIMINGEFYQTRTFRFCTKEELKAKMDEWTVKEINGFILIYDWELPKFDEIPDVPDQFLIRLFVPVQDYVYECPVEAESDEELKEETVNAE